MQRALVLAVAVISACSGRKEIALDYELTGIDLTSVIRVETYLSVAPGDGRAFFADQPYRSVAQGVGYEVRDFDGSGVRRLLITHDETLGFVFTPAFTFTLLPPAGESAPALVVTARAVGASTMLGQTGNLPTHFGTGVTLKVPLTDMRCNGVACSSDQQCCSQLCSSTASDAENCGVCGHACAPGGDSCQGGNCLCGGGSGCQLPQTCCTLLGCVDLQSDAFNCGACGLACNPGESCLAGRCACNGAAACGSGGLCCQGSGCSSNGSCPCGAAACNSPNTCCNDTSCVDLKGDNGNCGSCGNACATGLNCQNGACTCNGQICSTGDTCCSTGCADLQTSTANCGACGNTCATNETCSGGVCKCGASSCAAGQSCCGSTCLQLTSDSMNCGGCGVACNAGEQCVSSHCQCPGTNPPRACTSSETCCAMSATTGSAGGCFDLSSNHDNCNQCGKSCAPNEQCVSGSCHATGCNPPCTNGNVCNDSLQCVCNAGPACSGNDTCCAGAGCFNLQQTPTHCGTCTNDVTPALCCGGSSTQHTVANCSSCGDSCAFGQLCCADANLAYGCVGNSVDNCGACGNSCPPESNKLQRMCCSCGAMGACGVACTQQVCASPPPTGPDT